MRQAIIILGLLFLSGCYHHAGGIASSTKPLSPNGYTIIGKVEGRDCVYHLLGLIPLSNGNELKEALADAMNKRPYADALIEVTADTYFQWWLLFTRGCTQVYGTAVQSK